MSISRQATCKQKVYTELHGFADASEHGYGACLYLRTIDKDDNSSSRLLCSKSRVAPLKTQTIPRLELCAAVLLAEIADKSRIALSLVPNKTYCCKLYCHGLNLFQTIGKHLFPIEYPEFKN